MEIELNIMIQILEPNIKSIIMAYIKMLPELLRRLIQTAILKISESYMNMEEKPFKCERCGNRREFIWKTRHGKITYIFTVFMKVGLNQLQVQCKRCGHKFYITRKVLGMEPRERITKWTVKKLGLIGALTSFRVSEKIANILGWAIDKMTIWRCVQRAGKEIEFDLDLDEMPEGEADGTGIPIRGIDKRGKEMKVFVQKKKTGGVRIAGLSIGDYNKGWDMLFGPIKESLEKFKEFLIVTDGDTSIFEGILDKVKVMIQRCLWHIPYQLKYTLWRDKVKRDSEKWLHIMAEIFDICSFRFLIKDTSVIEEIIKEKEKKLNKLISYCTENDFKSSVSYLENAKPDMFSAIKRKFEGKTNSHVERVMRTLNMRINVGKWSTNGLLNAAKIRLAYYYNGFDV